MAPGGPDGRGARWTAQAARPEAQAERDEHDAVQDELAGPAATRAAAGPEPVAAAGAWGHGSAARQAQALRASLVQVTATLLWSAPILAGYGSGSGFAAEARWRAPDGPVRTGELFVTPDAAASHRTRIWVDQTGRLTNPPLSGDQMTGRAQLAAGVAVGSLAAVLAMAGGLVRRSLDRRRLSGWDTEWLANGPRWSPRR
jgi:hypothetical protein